MAAPAKATAVVYGSVPTSEAPAALRTVQVVAPSDLPAFYSFYVWEAARPSTGVRVQVPAGGVRAGERFAAIVVDDDNDEGGPHAVPTGKWRDGLCDCLRFGCCHPQCCLTWWCGPCALGQILTRFRLDWCGTARGQQPPPPQGRTAFFVLFWLYAAYLVVSSSLSAVVGQYSGAEETDDVFGGVGGDGGFAEDLESAPAWVQALSATRSLLDLALGVFLIVVTLRLRRYLRDRYRIPERYCCIGCEDFCCALWCLPCAICQMGRHSADYGRYRGGCCTEDGLADGVPAVV